MIEAISLRLSDSTDRPPADLRLVNGRSYGIFDAGDGAASHLLAALAGAEPVAGGTVRINGFDPVLEPVSAGGCVGYLSPSVGFYERMRVWDLLCFVAELRGVVGAKGAREIHAILEELELDGVRDRMLCRLGTDEHRRVCLAQALVGDPDLLFFDHPTKGLKRDNAAALRTDLAGLRERGKTLFLASDSPSELLGLCDRFLFVDGTGISQPLEPEELAEAAPSPALSAFLALNNRTKEKKQPEKPVEEEGQS